MIDLLAGCVVRAGHDVHAGVVVAGDDQVGAPQVLAAGRSHARRAGLGVGVVQLAVDRIGHLPGVAEDGDVRTVGVGGEVGVAGIGGHRDRVPGV